MKESIDSLRSDPSRITVEGPAAGSETAGRIVVDHYGRNSVDLTVKLPRAAFLASSEANYPGWRATIDDHPAPIYDTNAAFRGLNVPAGTHHVQFTFAPAILYVSLSISAFAWLVWFYLMRGPLPWQTIHSSLGRIAARSDLPHLAPPDTAAKPISPLQPAIHQDKSSEMR
jgi:hypothetical protein